jgi:hypothetical protein
MANVKLEKMKYSELQKLAKQLGIKANMKVYKPLHMHESQCIAIWAWLATT